MAVLADEVFGLIHQAQFGEHLGKSPNPQFFNDLSTYQKALVREGTPTISIPAIRSWLRRDRRVTPKRAEAMYFLHGYVQWVVSRKLVRDRKRKEVLVSVQRFLTRYDRAASFARQAHGAASATIGQKSKGADPAVIGTVQRILSVSEQNPHAITNDLFRDGDSGDQTDLSFFLMYRHSTNHGSILKSFLVCQKPDPKLLNHYGFNHFIWGGEGKGFASHIYRECEGIILKFDKAYYFFGYNFAVSANKRRNPTEYERLRAPSREQPNGIGMLAIEYDDLNLRPGLFGGVTMTLAAAQQPVVARVALLHLGTRSGLGVTLSDHLVEPTELYPRQLADDLWKVVDKIKKLGCKRFGSHLYPLVTAKEWGKRGASNLAHEILGMIDNTPAWESKNARNISHSDRKLRGRGAIETFGLIEGSRPRE